MSTYGLSVLGADLKSLAQTAQAADAAGFDAVWASEFYSRSGSISMAAMANSTQNCRIGSSILYGVGRSPLVLATEARDLVAASPMREGAGASYDRLDGVLAGLATV